MDLASFNQLAQDALANGADQGELSNILAQMTTGFSEEVSARVNAEKERDNLSAKNTKLKEDNMNLFLKITVPAGDDGGGAGNKRPEVDDDPINSLFTNGRLVLKG